MNWTGTSADGADVHDQWSGAFGAFAARADEALRRGVRWIVDVTRGLYREAAAGS